MAKIRIILILVLLSIGLIVNAGEERSAWKKKSFTLALNEFINIEDKIYNYYVLAWYLSSVNKRKIGESAVVLVEARNKQGKQIYYLEVLQMSHRNTQSNEWRVVWRSHDKMPLKIKRFFTQPSNEDIYSLLEEATWNWGCNNISITINGQVRNKVWEEQIGERLTKDFVGEKLLVCNKL